MKQNKAFRTQIDGERTTIPAEAVFSLVLGQESNAEVVEFQFKWKLE